MLLSKIKENIPIEWKDLWKLWFLIIVIQHLPCISGWKDKHFRWRIIHFLPPRLCYDLYDLIIIRGQAQRAVAPIVIVWFFIFGPWGSMAALWREHRKMMKFGTLVVMVINSDLTNFGVSRTNSIAPPPVQKFNIEMVITPEPLNLEKWNLVHLITLFMLITFNSLH